MIGEAAKEFSRSLQNLKDQKPPARSLRIDTFKLPYYEFKESFQWPSVSLSNLSAKDAENLMQIIVPRFGSDLNGFSMLPQAIPQRDEPSLIFVKSIEVNSRTYLIKYRIYTTYMGGALDEELHSKLEQDKSPSFTTTRIYFQKYVFPVTKTESDNGWIHGFEPYPLEHVINIRPMDLDVSDRGDEMRSTALFDQYDFSYIESIILKYLRSDNLYKPGSLFHPFTVQHLSLAWNAFALNDLTGYLHRFDRLIDVLKNSVPPFDSLKKLAGDWSGYFAAWRIERIMSRGGNPHWIIHSHPETP